MSMSEFDPGHGWQDEDERQMEKMLNLTEDEAKVYRAMRKEQADMASKFTFWMREHQATPKQETWQFKGKMSGKTIERLYWLLFFVVKSGWRSQGEIFAKILELGIMSVYEIEQKGMAIAMARAEMMAQMPPVARQATEVNLIREAIKYRKKVEDDVLRESLGEHPHTAGEMEDRKEGT